jgi:flagellar motor switch protein FliG
MVLTGKQKAAMLLMSLDIGTASELLKGIEPETVQELAVELSYLNASGYNNSRQNAEIARQFYSSLQSQPTFHFKGFLNEMLKSTVGDEKATQIQTQIQDLLYKRDPFINIRSTDLKTLASVLENEHPQAVAVVLSEMPARKSSEIIGLLGEGMRLSAISRMTSVENVTTEAKGRIAETVNKHLETLAASSKNGAPQAQPDESLRKVAVILRNLEKELRDGILDAIQKKDSEASKKVNNLMIVWDDIPQVADRPLQEALRGIDERQLALALRDAPDNIIQKIRANISERAVALVDEEASLMSAPKKEEIKEAREKIVGTLHEMNSKGELSFIEE